MFKNGMSHPLCPHNGIKFMPKCSHHLYQYSDQVVYLVADQEIKVGVYRIKNLKKKKIASKRFKPKAPLPIKNLQINLNATALNQLFVSLGAFLCFIPITVYFQCNYTYSTLSLMGVGASQKVT